MAVTGGSMISAERKTAMLMEMSAAEELEAAIRRNQRSPEEVARLAVGCQPLSCKEWQRKAPPTTPDEPAAWEEFLRQRDAEREASLIRAAGVGPDRAPTG